MFTSISNYNIFINIYSIYHFNNIGEYSINLTAVQPINDNNNNNNNNSHNLILWPDGTILRTSLNTPISNLKSLYIYQYLISIYLSIYMY
jgi:hypothetical protein